MKSCTPPLTHHARFSLTHTQRLYELERLRKWCSSHIGDHCAFYALQRALEWREQSSHVDTCNEEETKARWQHEFEFAASIIERFSGHETPWCHLRYLAGRECRQLDPHRRCVPLSQFIELARRCESDTEKMFAGVQRTWALRFQLWLSEQVLKQQHGASAEEAEEARECCTRCLQDLQVCDSVRMSFWTNGSFFVEHRQRRVGIEEDVEDEK